MSNWVGLLALDGWVSSARLAEALHANDLLVAAFCQAQSPLAATRHVDQRVLIDRASLKPALEQFAALREPAGLIPCDESTIRVLHELFADRSTTEGLRQLIRRSLGDPQGYAVATSKWSTHALASRLDLRVPMQSLVDSVDQALGFAAEWGYPVILKREGTYGGIGCRVCRSERDIRYGYGGLLASGRLDKLKGRAEVWAGWRSGGSGHSAERLIIQRFHTGQLSFTAAVARDGVMLGGLAAIAECVHPQPTGASTVVRLHEAPELMEATEILVRELGYSGFIGVDFIIEQATGLAYLLEINPRVTPLCPLGRRLGADLCAAYAESFAGRMVTPETRQTTIAALFPNEWLRDPASPYLSSAYHDLPIQDPELMTWIYRHLPVKRRLMLQCGMLPRGGFDGYACFAGHQLGRVEIEVAPKPDFGREVT